MRGVIGNRNQLTRALTIAQIAIVLVLLVGAGLLLRSYAKVFSVPRGFSNSAIGMNVQLSAEMYMEKMNPRYNSAQKQVASFRHVQVAFLRQVLDRVGYLPGIQAAGLIDYLPLSGLEGLAPF